MPTSMRSHLDLNTNRKVRWAVLVLTIQYKMFQLRLPDFGPYNIDYTRNGRHMLISGTRGHVAAFEWQTGKLMFEVQLGEKVRHAKWLHNESFLAVAQKQNVFVYDQQGVEIHCLHKLRKVTRLDFLPYHMLLVAIVSGYDDVMILPTFRSNLHYFQRILGL